MVRSGRGNERVSAGSPGLTNSQGSGRAGKGRGRGARPSGGATRGVQTGQRARRPLADLIDYLKACVKTIDAGMGSPEEEAMMATRALEEMGERILLVAADQRGSRPVEKLLRRASSDGFADAFKHLMEAVPDLAPNQYGSHVLEVALSSWAERQGEDGSEAPSPAAGSQPPSAEPIVRLCTRLQDEGLYNVLAHDACASHSMRALLLALAGYAPQAQSKDQAAARAGLLPERRFKVLPEVAACRRAAGEAYRDLLKEDSNFCLNAHASPVVQLVLRILRAAGDETQQAQVGKAIVSNPDSGALCTQRCDALMPSPAGSRALEAVVETATPELFQELFGKYFRPRFRALVQGESGEFGAFVAARVVDGLRDEPQLMIAFAGMDFNACLGPEATAAQQAVALKFAEACLRLRTGHRKCAADIFAALGLQESSEHYRAWPTTLALSRTESLVDLLRVKRAAKEADDKGGTLAGDENIPTNPKSNPPALLKALPSSGPQLLGALLRFPAETVQPLNGGAPKLIACVDGLGAMARNRATARVLEAALAPASALQPKLRLKLASSFKGLLADLGPHPIGGWVCAALWRSSLGHKSLREAFAKELLAAEDVLRSDNYAVWKVCGLNQLKLHQGEWQEQQHKAGKAKRVFEDMLEGPEVTADALNAGKSLQKKNGRRDRVDVYEKVKYDLDSALLGSDMFGLGEAANVSSQDASRSQENVSSKKKDASEDATLKETLLLIAGKAPMSSRKRRKKAKEAAAAAQADDSESE